MVVEAVLAALASDGCYAVAAAVQQREAEQAPSRRLVEPRLLWHLVRRPRWVGAVGCMIVAAALHVFALAEGPLLVVQPLGVTNLVYAVILAAVLRSRRVRGAEMLAAIVVCAGLVGVLWVIPPLSGPALRLDDVHLLVVAATAVAVSGIAVAVAQRLGPLGRMIALSIGTGVAFGSISTLVRELAQQVEADGVGALLGWPVLAVLVLAAVGLLLAQSAYRVGNLGCTVAVITVVDIVVAGLWATALLGESLPTSLTGLLVLTGSAGVIVLGITVLATFRHDASPPPTTSPAHPPSAQSIARLHMSAHHDHAASLRTFELLYRARLDPPSNPQVQTPSLAGANGDPLSS
ncbi:MAG TPA: DMT family transporter [Pseudonocardiaceae bacterium]